MNKKHKRKRIELEDIYPAASSYEQFRKELAFHQEVVKTILSGETEEALASLSQYFHVKIPKLKVRALKDCLARYNLEDETIYLSNEELRKDPFIILHEFCHHFRPTCPERIADEFTELIIDARLFPSKEEYQAWDIIFEFFEERGVHSDNIFELGSLLKRSKEMMMKVNERLEKAGIQLKVTKNSFSF